MFGATGVTSPDALIAWAHQQPSTAFAALSPLVCTSDDPEAKQIITAAEIVLIKPWTSWITQWAR